MMLDMLAAISRKDYEDRRRRQKEGIKRAKGRGMYKGRQRDHALRETIKSLLRDKRSYSEIVEMTHCSRTTIASVSKELRKS